MKELITFTSVIFAISAYVYWIKFTSWIGDRCGMEIGFILGLGVPIAILLTLIF